MTFSFSLGFLGTAFVGQFSSLKVEQGFGHSTLKRE